MIKRRACADRRKQCIWTGKQDAASPTIAVEALLFTLVMDALEERDVATCDLLGFSLQTDIEGDILLWIDGSLALLLVKIDRKSWKKHLRYNRKNPVICSKLALFELIVLPIFRYYNRHPCAAFCQQEVNIGYLVHPTIRTRWLDVSKIGRKNWQKYP